MKITIGLGGDLVSDIRNITIGTPAGNKTVKAGWVGTAAGNKQFWSALACSIAEESGFAPVYDEGTPPNIIYYSLEVDVAIVGGSGSYTYVWVVESGTVYSAGGGNPNEFRSADGSSGVVHVVVTDTVTGVSATSNSLTIG